MMLDVLEVQDQLKNFSQEQLLKEMQMPSGSVPQFLILSELNRRRTMSQDMAKRQSADQPTVKEEVVAASGMPMDNVSMMAQQMAPKTSMTENTGIASMMPRELPSEEEPMKMSYGGVLNSRSMVMGQPLMSSMRPMAETFPPRMQQQRDNLGFNNLGSNIVDRIGEKSQGEVDEFIGEVRDMADDRFDLDLTPEPQFDSGGKGFPPFVKPSIAQRLVSNVSLPQPMYRKEGGPIKAQSGMFADIGSTMPPAFATIYNYAKTVLGLDDEMARDVANKTIQQDIPPSSEAVSGGVDFDATVPKISPVESGLGLKGFQTKDDIRNLQKKELERVANMAALDNFSGGREMSELVNDLGVPTTKGKDENPFSINIPSFNPADRAMGKGSTTINLPRFGPARFLPKKDPLRPSIPKGELDKYKEIFKDGRTSPLEAEDIRNKQIMDNFTGGREIDDLVDNLKKDQKEEEARLAAEAEAKRKAEEEARKKKEEDKILGGFGKASGALSDLSAQIAELKEKREKGRDSEKWFSLAKLGLGMLASASPTVFGALGEGGLKALEDFKAGKKAYDDDILGYLKTQASIEKSQAELGVRGLVAQKQIEALKKKGLTGMTQKERATAILNIDKELNDLYKPGDYDLEDPKIKRAIFNLETQKRRLQLNLPVGPTVMDKDLTSTTAIG